VGWGSSPFSSSSDLEQDENRSATIVTNENKSFSINRIIFVGEGTLKQRRSLFIFTYEQI
jgi:hypothetical protein